VLDGNARISSGKVRTPSLAFSWVQALATPFAYMQMVGDDAVGLALGHECERLQLPHRHALKGLVVPLASMKATSEARS
jgi:hypothetical protein